MTGGPFKIYLVSDATGNTLKTLAQSCLSQFEGVETNISTYSLISDEKKLDDILSVIKKNPGLVLYTIPNQSLHKKLNDFCKEQNIICFDMLKAPLKVMSDFFNKNSVAKPGEKSKFDDRIITKIVAIEYTLKFEEENPNLSELDKADVILVGPSRTSKTTAAIYLANKEFKVASFTFYPDKNLPEDIFRLKDKLIIGFIAKPERLIELRRSRLRMFDPFVQTDYLDEKSVEEEIIKARRLYTENFWQTIDITNRAMEDICQDIIEIMKKKQGMTR